ncbi:MAG: deoxyribodipyrimidine photo-lyase, partial [Candidatus Gastranaerophilales bacterium]|nr:deoxyribodipyrimidine photo-lyase [Candidatus Gastranaerophilales bacterium]
MQNSLTNSKRYKLLDILPENIGLEKIVNPKRYWQFNNNEYNGGKILYWINRDKRVSDNPALMLAQEIALKENQPLVVFFNFETTYTLRKLDFLIKGLRETENILKKLNIPFIFSVGNASENILQIIEKTRAG